MLSRLQLPQMWALARVDARRLQRARGTLRFAVVSPALIVGLFALLRDLRFGLPADGLRIDVFDFAVTGMIGFWAAHFAQDTMVAAASAYRARGLLKRIAVTPIRSTTFVAADLGARTLIGVAQTLLMLVLAAVVGVSVKASPNLLWLLPLSAVATLTGLGFGFAIAGLARTPEAANSLNLLAGLLIFMLAGIWIPIEALPDGLEQVARYAFPFTSVVQAMRDIVLAGAGLGEVWGQALVGLGWMLIALVLGIRAYPMSAE